MKKRILWICAILLIVLFAGLVVPLAMFYYNHIWKYSADYESFAEDFDVVKNYISTEFSGASDKWLSVSSDGNGGVRLFDPGINNYLVLPDDVASSLASIRKSAFPDKDSDLDTIRIQEGRISFCISCGEYALVYSPNEKPSWVNSPSENLKVRVKAIQNGWYHVTIAK